MFQFLFFLALLGVFGDKLKKIAVKVGLAAVILFVVLLVASVIGSLISTIAGWFSVSTLFIALI